MKKLLALVLCVVMVLSLAPAAFAANGDEATDPTAVITVSSVSEYSKMIENMIKNTRKNTEKAYKVLVGDQSVYNTAKSMDDAVVNLVNNFADTIVGKKVLKDAAGNYTVRWTKANTDNVKAAFRKLIDTKVAEKYAENSYKALDADGNIDPILRARTFAESVSKVMTDKDMQKGIEAVATYFAVLNLADSVNTELKDKYDDFRGSIDSKFDTEFDTRYPTLYANVIDTFEENGGVYGDADAESWIQYLLTAPGATTD